MLKKIFPVLLLLCFIFPVNANESALLNSESIGEFHLGLSEHEVSKKIHCHIKKSPDTLWGADGIYHQTWDCYESGISFDMVSNKKGGAKTIASIMLSAPSQLKTKRGIHIGSTEQEVETAYAKEKEAETSRPHKSFVAGSIYGGLIFQFKNGVVESIFLGAGAE